MAAKEMAPPHDAGLKRGVMRENQGWGTLRLSERVI